MKKTAASRWPARVTAFFGGPARTRVVLLLSGVLALNTADSGTIGAVAPPLEAALGISHTQLGLLATVSSGVGILAAPVAGLLADRTARVRLLTATIVVWSAAMVAGGLASGYLWLLLSRLALGAALAAAGPMVASLIGDLFPPEERARAYGWVLGGEILGAGAGLLVGGDVALLLSWRAPFFLLAAASLAMAFALWRLLPEPSRGGTNWLRPGARRIDRGNGNVGQESRPTEMDRPSSDARAAVAGKGVSPADDRVLRTDPTELSWWSAARYLLRIPTVRTLIVASSVGYFFFAGLRTFVVVFAIQHYALPRGLVSFLVLAVGAGALAGTLAGGRIADRAVRHGHPTVRVVLPAIGYAAAGVLFAPGLVLTTILPALALFTAAAAFLAAANPPLDAARLDIVPGRLWGRAESVRTVLRLAAEGIAPIVFGFTADALGGSAGRAAGLRDAFLIMLVPLFANALIVLGSRRTYPQDVVTAAASDEHSPTGSRAAMHR